ncbi:hypothetical protein D3C81_2044680 [compost metagenome]
MALAGEGAQFLGDGADAGRQVADAAQGAGRLGGLVPFQPGGRRFGLRENGGDRLIDFMRHAGGDLAQGRQLASLHQFVA